MQKINDTTVEMTEAEALIAEIHSVLMDLGHSQTDALDIITGKVVPDGLRSETPLLDGALTPDFIAWLTA